MGATRASMLMSALGNMMIEVTFELRNTDETFDEK